MIHCSDSLPEIFTRSSEMLCNGMSPYCINQWCENSYPLKSWMTRMKWFSRTCLYSCIEIFPFINTGPLSPIVERARQTVACCRCILGAILIPLNHQFSRFTKSSRLTCTLSEKQIKHYKRKHDKWKFNNIMNIPQKSYYFSWYYTRNWNFILM